MKVSADAIIKALLGLLFGLVSFSYGLLVDRFNERDIQHDNAVSALFARVGVLEVQHADSVANIGAVRDRTSKLESATDRLDERQRQSEASIRNRP